MAAVAAGFFYLIAGVFGGSIGMVFTALPVALIHTIAGLALLGTIAGSLYRALENERQRDAAIITFLITASGVTLLGVGSAFWGLVGDNHTSDPQPPSAQNEIRRWEKLSLFIFWGTKCHFRGKVLKPPFPFIS